MHHAHKNHSGPNNNALTVILQLYDVMKFLESCIIFSEKEDLKVCLWKKVNLGHMLAFCEHCNLVVKVLKVK